MPYKRLSRFPTHFWSPDFTPESGSKEFFNSHVFTSTVAGKIVRAHLEQGTHQGRAVSHLWGEVLSATKKPPDMSGFQTQHVD